MDGSARLEWVDWKQFSKLPPGAVSVKQDHFVARDTLKTGKETVINDVTETFEIFCLILCHIKIILLL